MFDRGPNKAGPGGYDAPGAPGGYGNDGHHSGGPGGGFNTGGGGGQNAPFIPPQGLGAQMQVPETQSGVAGYEKRIQWQLVFFVGAVMTVVSGAWGILYFIFFLFNASSWGPCAFLSSIFLTVFGLLMVVLDFPAHRPEVDKVRMKVYTFLLFMTRFCGRGLWYLFLGTHVWVVLYDEGVQPVLGCIVSIYLLLVGLVSFAKGYYLSRKLDSVRNHLKENQIGPQHFPSGLDKEQFKQLIGDGMFTDSELGYIINALSLRATGSDGRVSSEEFNAWLAPGPMTIV